MYRYETPDQPGKWTRILSPPTVPPTHFPTKQSNPPELPLPRYAHQVVYDLETKTLYMHGGNAGLDKDEVSEVEIVEVVPGISPPFGDRGARTAPGRGGDARVGNQDEAVWDGGEREEGHGSRLDDFWSMRLQRCVVFPGLVEFILDVNMTGPFLKA